MHPFLKFSGPPLIFISITPNAETSCLQSGFYTCLVQIVHLHKNTTNHKQNKDPGLVVFELIFPSK